MEKQYFDCQCDCNEHVIRFVLDPTDGDVWTEVHLRPQGWSQRLLIAVRYVFGRQSAFGAFDCTLLRPADYPRLNDLLARSASIKAAEEVTEFTVSLPENQTFRV